MDDKLIEAAVNDALEVATLGTPGEVVVQIATHAAQAALRARDEWMRENGMAMVPVEPSFDVKMAGAAAITKDHMRKMANYDAAIDCWSAMIAALQEADK